MKRMVRIAEMRAWSRSIHDKGKTIGLVPTMGALHAGHLSLVRAARQACDAVVVSIFVNPTQFGPSEDYRRYPRPLARDLQLLHRQRVDAVFTPPTGEMYPKGFDTHVHAGKLSEKLCGPFRPGHFDGVATVVLKLFEIVAPDIAFFGQKDFQQQLIVKQMVRDLDLPVKVIDLPTIREQDGLAMSSRNRYLTSRDHTAATWIYRSLVHAQQRIHQGERDSEKLRREIKKLVEKIPHVRVDYISICNPETLTEKKRATGKTLIALAVHVGKTRLIDNILV